MVRNRSSVVNPLSSTDISDRNVDTLFMVWLVSRSTAGLLDTALRAVNVSADEFAIYSILNKAPGITPSELARWMAAPATTVSSYLKRLETRGHLIRLAHPQDRRSYRLALSDSGELKYQAAKALFAPVRSRVTRGLAAEEGDVRRTLLRLRAVLDDVRQGADQDLSDT
jgi:DNA-binding MarR family transcriptional regulator